MNVNHLENAFSEFAEPKVSPKLSRQSLLRFPKSDLVRIQPSPMTHLQSLCRLPPVLHQYSSGSFPLSANPFNNLELQSLPPQCPSLLLEATSLSQGRKVTSKQNPGLPWGSPRVFSSSENHSPVLPAAQSLTMVTLYILSSLIVVYSVRERYLYQLFCQVQKQKSYLIPTMLSSLYSSSCFFCPDFCLIE